MIVPASNVQVLVATKPVDFRCGMDRLAALVQESLSADPFCGAIYVFRAKRANRVKVLWWDGSGICTNSGGLASRMGSCICRRHSFPPCWKASILLVSIL